ncbi:methylase [Propioniciclava sinopodophylli]|uniref:Methylase n=1 Tax=Propioniciclava sinopodophylli TaxID=1837344 RepID=A0A4Q9KCZ4_9ACTN|nr:RsmD family RNA methyltransferase [Propioniciclava sinopodophylli]TBT84321.1 methylase [Propioniciclava sinopodophylli]
MSRIIAGSAGGHRLATPSHSRTRPTSDLVRESAFNLIADWAGTVGEPADAMLERFSFLDLYGGTGAVALEAASRGAGPVVCVEKDRGTAALARGNADATGLPVQVVAQSVDAYLAGTPHTFDVVWFDPPYEVPTAVVEAQVAAVVDRWLASDGLVIVERSSRDTPPSWPISLTDVRKRRYGETTLYLAAKEDDA